jgi:branched-chain amino acid transport system substrate-binding protein
MREADFLTGTISSAVAQPLELCKEKENLSQHFSILGLTEENWHRYIFRIDTNAVPYWGYAPAVALAKKWKDKKIVSLGFDYETGKNSLKAFKEKYLELVPDAKIIDELWAPLGTTDFTPYISKIANSGADAFFSLVSMGRKLLSQTGLCLAFIQDATFNLARAISKPGLA